MTGGQPVDGPLKASPRSPVSSHAEGVGRIALCPTTPSTFSRDDHSRRTLPCITGRDTLDAVQRELRASGRLRRWFTTDLRHREAPAAQARHVAGSAALRRHQRAGLRGLRRLFGGIQLPQRWSRRRPSAASGGSTSPAATRTFPASTGFCPSFVTVEGATPPQDKPRPEDLRAGRAPAPPAPAPARRALRPSCHRRRRYRRHHHRRVRRRWPRISEGKGASGARLHRLRAEIRPGAELLRLRRAPRATSTRSGSTRGAADALIGCDLVASSAPKASGRLSQGTRAVVNTAEMPTGDIVRARDADLRSRRGSRRSHGVVGAEKFRLRRQRARRGALSATASTPT